MDSSEPVTRAKNHSKSKRIVYGSLARSPWVRFSAILYRFKGYVRVDSRGTRALALKFVGTDWTG